MTSVGVWSMFAIFFQTIIALIISWVVLSCKLNPDPRELREVTLIKLLYLFDPAACGRTQFYNYTVLAPTGAYGYKSAIVWPEQNDVAASFRGKIRLWLSLHLIWSLLCLINLTQRHRPCGFYATLIPFTLTGLALLIVDVVFSSLFLIDARFTDTELQILKYINSNTRKLHTINTPAVGQDEDTSWAAVVLAYLSVRGVVPWFVNFWIVKDMYFDGLNTYRRLRSHYAARKRLNSAPSSFINV